MNPSVNVERQASDGVFDLLTGLIIFEYKSQMKNVQFICYDGKALHRL